MSVIHFGADELANLGMVCLHSTPDRAGSLERVCKELETISRANADCYSYRYSTEAAYVSADMITDAMRLAVLSGRKESRESALGVASLLHYNCQEGRDFLAETPDGLQALVSILERLLK